MMTGLHLSTQVSAGYTWGRILLLYTFPIICIITGIGGAFLAYSKFGKLVSVIGGFLCAAAFVGIFVGANWPLQAQYHEYVPTTITVSQIANRFVADGSGGANQRFVVVSQDGTPYAVDDTRASLLKVGQEVTLMCVREYEQNGVPGFACNWGELGPNAP